MIKDILEDDLKKRYESLINTFNKNEVNTIPLKVELIITFKEATPISGEYNLVIKGKEIIRPAGLIKAIIKYNNKAGHLRIEQEYPLSLCGGALTCLNNYLNNEKKSHNLNNRTFRVIKINSHTYLWEEI